MGVEVSRPTAILLITLLLLFVSLGPTYDARRSSSLSSARAEQHDRNVPLGPGLVGVVVGPLLRHDRPDAALLLGRRRAGPDGEDLVAHLDLDVGVRDQVSVPSRVLRRSTLR